MSGAQIEELIYEWLNTHYPDGPTWFGAGEPTLDLPPLELRMFYAMNVIEYNISNGGWSQFLWNCFDGWKAILDTAQAGYLLMGAKEQAEALDTLRALCEGDEKECHEAQDREDGSMDAFGEYTKRSYAKPGNDWQALFWGDIYERRLAWLEANESRVRKLTGRLDA